MGGGSKRAGGGIYEHGLGKFKEIYNAGLRPDQNTVVVGEREGVEQRGGEGVGGRGKKGLSMKRDRERGGDVIRAMEVVFDAKLKFDHIFLLTFPIISFLQVPTHKLLIYNFFFSVEFKFFV